MSLPFDSMLLCMMALAKCAKNLSAFRRIRHGILPTLWPSQVCLDFLGCAADCLSCLKDCHPVGVISNVTSYLLWWYWSWVILVWDDSASTSHEYHHLDASCRCLAVVREDFRTLELYLTDVDYNFRYEVLANRDSAVRNGTAQIAASSFHRLISVQMGWRIMVCD